MKNLKFGFTLAEVLITLGVIGIVSAVTLPIIHGNIQKYVLKNQFKKAYSNFSNVVNQVVMENGTNFACGLSDGTYKKHDCPIFWENIFKKYKVIKTCNYGENNCSPTYKTLDKVLEQGGKASNKTCSHFSGTTGIAHFLTDGSIIYTTIGGYQDKVYYAIDVNGTKKPNQWGYDVFYLNLRIVNNNTLKPNGTNCSMYEKGGNTFENMFNY